MIEIIKEIIDDKYLFEDQKFIKEKDDNARGKKFEMKFEIVKNNSINYYLYRFDSKDFPFFKEVKNLKKMCDYILFAEERKFLHIFLIEIKLGPESAKKQLLAAEEFALFLIKSAKRVEKEIKNYKIKKIRISQKNVNKLNRLSIQNNLIFDKDNYIDYKLKSIYLSILMQY